MSAAHWAVGFGLTFVFSHAVSRASNRLSGPSQTSAHASAQAAQIALEKEIATFEAALPRPVVVEPASEQDLILLAQLLEELDLPRYASRRAAQLKLTALCDAKPGVRDVLVAQDKAKLSAEATNSVSLILALTQWRASWSQAKVLFLRKIRAHDSRPQLLEESKKVEEVFGEEIPSAVFRFVQEKSREFNQHGQLGLWEGERFWEAQAASWKSRCQSLAHTIAARLEASGATELTVGEGAEMRLSYERDGVRYILSVAENGTFSLSLGDGLQFRSKVFSWTLSDALPPRYFVEAEGTFVDVRPFQGFLQVTVNMKTSERSLFILPEGTTHSAGLWGIEQYLVRQFPRHATRIAAKDLSDAFIERELAVE